MSKEKNKTQGNFSNTHNTKFSEKSKHKEKANLWENDNAHCTKFDKNEDLFHKLRRIDLKIL